MIWKLVKRLDFLFGLVRAVGVIFSIFVYLHTQKKGIISYSILTQRFLIQQICGGLNYCPPTVRQLINPSLPQNWYCGILVTSALARIDFVIP